MTIEELGYNDFFESGRNDLGLSGFPVARVIAEHREAYTVTDGNVEYFARITGKHIYTATSRNDYPAVGDWVAISILEQGAAVIRGILPRKSTLTRKYSDKQEGQIIATNIDIALITESMDRDYNVNRIDRFLVIAREGKIRAALILNKSDLISPEELAVRTEGIKKRFHDMDIIATSIVNLQGIRTLESYIEKGKTYCLLGSSGVGKSSLINALLGRNEIKTGDISGATQRGRHTTTAREIHMLKNGGILIDNPGTREVGLAEAEEGVSSVFDDILLLASGCRFSDCSHTNEPGCAVLKALDGNLLDEHTYENYLKLKKEADFYSLTELEKRNKDRKFGQFVKKTLQELKK